MRPGAHYHRYRGDPLPGLPRQSTASRLALVWFLFCLSLLASCQPVQSQDIPDKPVRTATRLPLASPRATFTPLPSSPTPPDQTHTPIPASPTPSQTPTAAWPPENWLFPDSEVIYGPSALDFDVGAYLEEAGGFLNTYRQYLMITAWTSAADIIQRVALENSINPRLLLALLEYQSGSVWGQVADPDEFQAAMGAVQSYRLDLYGQVVWAAHYLEDGYYGWRSGTLTQFSLPDGTIIIPPPDSNAGTVALQYFFAQLLEAPDFQQVFDPQEGFLPTYQRLFPGTWERASQVEPLVPPDTQQPPLGLPISSGRRWAFISGPHPAFEKSGPLAALDFAPPTAVTGCYQSEDWVVAMADGVVVRSELGVVVQDLDGDGYEQTGWVLFYLHIEDRHRVPLGTELAAGDPIGHPSCEGGRATGSHVHVARKYNGEWIPADGPIPFVMDGWQAHNGEASYFGSLTRGDETIQSHLYASRSCWISRDE